MSVVAATEIERSRTAGRLPALIHTVASLRPDHGGPSRSVALLCGGLARQGFDVQLITDARRPGEPPPAPAPPDVLLRQAPAHGWLAGARPFARLLNEALVPTSILHDHGLWLPTNHAAARAASTLERCRVVSPRGMLSEWSLGHRRWKKKAAWRLYQRTDLATATALHATSAGEAEEIRRAGLCQPIAIIPNGVELPPRCERTTVPRSPRRALFLSRLHPKKGPDVLLEAWAAVRPPGWELVIAGPDETGIGARLERRAAELALTDSVSFRGPVDDEEKWALYSTAELFVLPTRSENFGLVIAEALASGLPVITTKAAPWPTLVSHDCGWWIDVGIPPLIEALTAATRSSSATLASRGENGRALVEGELAWPTVAAQMGAVYSWLAGLSPMPPQVQLA